MPNESEAEARSCTTRPSAFLFGGKSAPLHIVSCGTSSIGASMQMPRLLSRSPAIGGTRYPRESLIYWLQNRRAWPWGESRTRAVRLTRPFGPEEAKSSTLILSMYLSITERAETCNSQKVARALRRAFRKDRDYLKPVKTLQNKNVWTEYPYNIWLHSELGSGHPETPRLSTTSESLE